MSSALDIATDAIVDLFQRSDKELSAENQAAAVLDALGIPHDAPAHKATFAYDMGELAGADNERARIEAEITELFDGVYVPLSAVLIIVRGDDG